MRLPILPLPFKPPRLNGLPRALTDSQYEQHYGATLRRHNELADLKSPADAETVSRLRVDISLHELALTSLTDEPTPAPATLASRLDKDLAGSDALTNSLRAAAARRMDGWLTLCANRSNMLQTFWCPPHTGLPADLRAVLAFDLSPRIWTDHFPDNPDTYIDALLLNINWSAANEQLITGDSSNQPGQDQPGQALLCDAPNTPENPPLCAPEELASTLNAREPVRVIDVRLGEDLQPDDIQIAGSAWHNPQTIKELAASLSEESDVVVYCMYGAWVSQEAASTLRSLGVNARALAGGISSWTALDLPHQSLDAAARKAIQ